MLKLLLLIVSAIALIPPALAHCPLCTAAVGSGAVVAKYFGLDASIIGIFAGAFGVSTGLWIGLKIRRIIPFQVPLIIVASYLLTVLPILYIIPDSLYMPVLLAGEPGGMLNKVYFVNKLLLGSIAGFAACIAAFWIHIRIKKLNGRVLFPYQGVALTVGALFITSAALFFVVR